MISFDSSEIVNWTDRPDAHHVLPELVRRLILATIPSAGISGHAQWQFGADARLGRIAFHIRGECLGLLLARPLGSLVAITALNKKRTEDYEKRNGKSARA